MPEDPGFPTPPEPVESTKGSPPTSPELDKTELISIRSKKAFEESA